MFKNLIIILPFLFLLYLKLSIGIKSADFRNIIDKECKGSHSLFYSYKVICQPVDCAGKYKFPCGKQRCSIDK